MIKMMSLMKRKETMSFDDFRNWLFNEHVAFARDMSGLRKYTVNVLLNDNPDAPYDGVSELYFDSEQAMADSFATEAGKAAGADAAAHCSSRLRMVCEEKLQF